MSSDAERIVGHGRNARSRNPGDMVPDPHSAHTTGNGGPYDGRCDRA